MGCGCLRSHPPGHRTHRAAVKITPQLGPSHCGLTSSVTAVFEKRCKAPTSANFYGMYIFPHESYVLELVYKKKTLRYQRDTPARVEFDPVRQSLPAVAHEHVTAIPQNDPAPLTAAGCLAMPPHIRPRVSSLCLHPASPRPSARRGQQFNTRI